MRHGSTALRLPWLNSIFLLLSSLLSIVAFKKCLYNRVLDSTKFPDETYILISRMHQVLIDQTYDKPNVKSLELRNQLSYLLAITPYASQRAIAVANVKSEGSEKRFVDRPHKSLNLNYSFAVVRIVKNISQTGYPNTVKATTVALKDPYYFNASY